MGLDGASGSCSGKGKPFKSERIRPQSKAKCNWGRNNQEEEAKLIIHGHLAEKQRHARSLGLLGA